MEKIGLHPTPRFAILYLKNMMWMVFILLFIAASHSSLPLPPSCPLPILRSRLNVVWHVPICAETVRSRFYIKFVDCGKAATINRQLIDN